MKSNMTMLYAYVDSLLGLIPTLRRLHVAPDHHFQALFARYPYMARHVKRVQIGMVFVAQRGKAYLIDLIMSHVDISLRRTTSTISSMMS